MLAVGKHRGHPPDFGDERHHTGLPLRDLHVRPQFLYSSGGQFHGVPFSQVQNRFQPNASIDMPMQSINGSLGSIIEALITIHA